MAADAKRPAHSLRPAGGRPQSATPQPPSGPTAQAQATMPARPAGASSTVPGGRVWMWADIPAEILGVVLRLLPCLADRASVLSVCRHWRASARIQIQDQPLPAPLPVLVQPTFRFSCLTSDGRLTAARRSLMPAEVAGEDVRVVGSSEDWLMTVRDNRPVGEETDGECFLVHGFSGELVHLPPLGTIINFRNSEMADYLLSFFLETGKREPWLHCSAVLSASPSSGSKYIVAARNVELFQGLALWQPGMTSWHLCQTGVVRNMHDDLAFYQGKLYVLWKFQPKIFALELTEDDKHGVSLSLTGHREINPLLPSMPSHFMRCNMVVWRGKLLLIIRFFSDDTHMAEFKLHSVQVFALDFSTSPCGLNQIHNFAGDCITVDTNGCRSFSTGSHAGVQGDLIYFSDEPIINHFAYTSVYNVRDGTVRRFAAPLLVYSGVQEGRHLDFPVWMFPSS